jgi:hypothetical protein
VKLVVLGISLRGAQYHIRDAALISESGVCSAAAYVMSKPVTPSAGLVFGKVLVVDCGPRFDGKHPAERRSLSRHCRMVVICGVYSVEILQ